MSAATVIIGAGYGDEGKGLLTDYFTAANGASIVVRFNGGCQAGHTVVLPSGMRHVFSHFSSGTFAGATTYLSRYFIANPMWFFRERALLEALGVRGGALVPAVDERALVTTPYDMIINQIVETARGVKRHGSCGTGIHETIERSERSPYAITAGDLMRARGRGQVALAKTLDAIRTIWMPARLRQLGVDVASEAATGFSPLLQGADLAERWLDDALNFADAIVPANVAMLAQSAKQDALIFEGAQGLMLDMTRGVFPHVTRSNTGLLNAQTLAREAGIERLDLVYAHRAYATRHGAGPFAHETGAVPYAGIVETTNVTNTYQGSFRFGFLDVDVLTNAIADDLSDIRAMNVTTTLAMTCLDQVDDNVTYFSNGTQHTAAREQLPEIVRSATSLDRVLTAYGPTRGDISEHAALASAGAR